MSKAWFDATGARLDESRMEIAIGSGPYVLDEFEVNKRISYKRNEDYWGNELPLMKGRSKFDTIKLNILLIPVLLWKASSQVSIQCV